MPPFLRDRWTKRVVFGSVDEISDDLREYGRPVGFGVLAMKHVHRQLEPFTCNEQSATDDRESESESASGARGFVRGTILEV